MKFVLTAALTCLLTLPAFAAGKESVYDRVMSAGTIRCGYATWAPLLMKDVNTGAMSGLFYDMMEEVGKRLSLKIVWAEEGGWGTIVEGLASDRYDMICNGLYINAARGRVIDFTDPVFFSPFYVVVRADDARFDADYMILNDPQYKLTVLEGEQSALSQSQLFPRASVTALPQLSDYTMLLRDVESGKADATMMEPGAFADYDRQNPGKLKITGRDRPINVFPVGFGTPRGDVALKRMIEITLGEMMYDGTIDRLITRYAKDQYEGAYLPVKRPYDPAPAR